MARWKAHVEFLSVIELLFLSLPVEALQGKMCQESLLSGGGRSVPSKISGGSGRPWGIFFGFYKTDTFCYPTVQTTPCYVPSFWHNTGVWQTDGQTDRQTDGIAIASTALAMRALRRAVKIIKIHQDFPELWRQMYCHVGLHEIWQITNGFTLACANIRS